MEPELTIEAVDAMDVAAFTEAFGAVLEDSPHLAARVAAAGPFGTVDALADAFAAVVADLDADAGLALVRAHPELGARRPMAAASVEEQSSAGLPDAEAEIQARLAAGNGAYRERFGFPFVIAVRGRTPAEIVAVLDERLGHERDVELATALDQVARIARLRVGQLVAAPDGAEPSSPDVLGGPA